jgi:folate-binding protein YgfZ
VQGRLLATVRIIHQEDGFFIDTESATLKTVAKLLERFTLAGDFRVTDLTSETAMLSVQGQTAERVVQSVLGEAAANIGRQEVATAHFESDGEVTVIRATHTAEDGFDLFVNANDAQALHESLTEAGAQPVGPEALETLRIEAGIPRYGIDMDETNVVTETGLDDAVSFTKGCYVGQEIIARIKYRGHVAKKLSGLIFEAQVALKSGARILSSDNKEVGQVTSFAFSPCLDRTIALGYVKYDYLEPGTNVKVSSGDDEIKGTVAELPFVRGSWYTD